MTPDDLRRQLQALTQGGGFQRAVNAALVETAQRAERQAKINAETVLRVRSGHLARSITGRVRQGTEGPEAVVSSGGRVGASVREVAYARTHEFGATIGPKRGQYLRVPFPAALTGAGVDRYGGPLRTMAPNLFRVLRAPSGRLYLVHIPSNRIWYALVRSVTIRARPFLRPAAEVAAEGFPRYLARAITREIARQ